MTLIHRLCFLLDFNLAFHSRLFLGSTIEPSSAKLIGLSVKEPITYCSREMGSDDPMGHRWSYRSSQQFKALKSQHSHAEEKKKNPTQTQQSKYIFIPRSSSGMAYFYETLAALLLGSFFYSLISSIFYRRRMNGARYPPGPKGVLIVTLVCLHH